MTYNPRPPDEPSFAPQPKPPLPPPGRNDPPNVDREPICVWFFYGYGPVDPANPKIWLPTGFPTKGTIDPDVFIPPAARGNPPWRRWIACDDLDGGSPYQLHCATPIDQGSAQYTSFCWSLCEEERILLRTLSEPNIVQSPYITNLLSQLAIRLGIATDDPDLLFRNYDIEILPPGSDCSACTKWWAGCYESPVDFGGCPKGLFGPVTFSNDLLDAPYSKGLTFTGPNGYAEASAFVNNVGHLGYYAFEGQPFGDIACLPCHKYCNEKIYNTEIDCICDNVAPGDNPPCECYPDGNCPEGGGN